MIRKAVFFSFLFLLPLAIVSINCSKEVAKTPKLVKPDTISPSHAWITGEITEIEPIATDMNADGPCSKAPCIAKVKVETIQYGSAFPVISTNKEIRIKFEFTLNKTTKELFPNMDESYPGLKVGDKIEALVRHSKTSDNLPDFQIYGYKINMIQPIGEGPAAIQYNQSIVTAQINSIDKVSKYDFKLNVTLLSVEENSAYASIAVKGERYSLTPNFRLNDMKEIIDNEVNNKLEKLGNLKKGDEFKAIIFLENNQGWFINSVIK